MTETERRDAVVAMDASSMSRSTEEIVVCLAMDAMRIAMGIKPKNYDAELVILWLSLMSNPKFSGGINYDN